MRVSHTFMARGAPIQTNVSRRIRSHVRPYHLQRSEGLLATGH